MPEISSNGGIYLMCQARISAAAFLSQYISAQKEEIGYPQKIRKCYNKQKPWWGWMQMQSDVISETPRKLQLEVKLYVPKETPRN